MENLPSGKIIGRRESMVHRRCFHAALAEETGHL
jgi:hypothetical protein